jgi:TATA-box binding protein (TBP) (component of TFIID and TFIIIB)
MDEDALLLDYLRQEEESNRESMAHFIAVKGIRMTCDNVDTSSTSSSDSSSEEEEEALICEKARTFVQNYSFGSNISKYELSHLRTSAALSPASSNGNIVIEEGQARLIARPEDRVTEADRKRSILRIRIPDTEVYVDVMLENYVYVTYFRNKHTKEKYRLNLCELAIMMLCYGILYCRSKFTKITLKYTNGPSHYLFGSGALVESGTYSPVIARKMHDHTMRILREHCHYESIEIEERKCQNIVAKGTLPFSVCLVLLKARHPNFVQYTDDFAGAIIRVNKIDNKTRCIPTYNLKNRRHYKRQKITLYTYETDTRKEEEEEGEDNEDEDDIDDVEEEEEEEVIEHYHSNNNNDDDSSSSSYEHFEMHDDDKICNENFDYHIPDPELLKQRASSEYTVLEKKSQRNKDHLLQIHNADDLDEYQVEALTKKKNVTILVFPKGRIICAGCKNRDQIIKAYAKSLDILASCSGTPENKLAEEKLIKEKELESFIIYVASLPHESIC